MKNEQITEPAAEEAQQHQVNFDNMLGIFERLAFTQEHGANVMKENDEKEIWVKFVTALIVSKSSDLTDIPGVADHFMVEMKERFPEGK